MRKLVLTAVLSSLATLGVQHWLGAAEVTTREVVLENAKVRILDRGLPPQGAREPEIRQTDQIIVFLADSKYERTDPETGEKTVRTRKAGEVIWHDKGEKAPRLVNVDSKPFRSLVIELK